MNFLELPPFQESNCLNVIIETPKGSRNKYAFDPGVQLFKLKKVLPAGAVFPYDFGFVPSTKGDDADPLDVLVLMDEPAFAGCWIEARLIGVIEANQTKDQKTNRNDRLIAVLSKTKTWSHVENLRDLNAGFLDEIEHFFVSYNAISGRKFEVLHRSGPAKAKALVTQGNRRYKESPGFKLSGQASPG